MDKNWQMLTKENKLIGLTILTVLFPGKYYHLANILLIIFLKILIQSFIFITQEFILHLLL